MYDCIHLFQSEICMSNQLFFFWVSHSYPATVCSIATINDFKAKIVIKFETEKYIGLINKKDGIFEGKRGKLVM